MKLRVFLLLAIALLALFLRVFQLSRSPGSLYWEETALLYDAHSIAETGKDMHGNPFPLIAFPSFGDYKPSLYFYAITPFVKIFGLQEISVKLPSILAGVGIAIFVFLIVEHLFGLKTAGIAGLLSAIQPWSVGVSRVGFETNLATFLICVGVYFFLRVKKHTNGLWIIFGTIAFLLSMYTYHSARVVAPLLLALFGFEFLRNWRVYWKPMSISFLIFSIGVLPFIMKSSSPELLQRAKETSIFSDLSIIQNSNAMRDAFGNTVFARIAYHRYFFFAREVAIRYTQNFSLKFLFVEGDQNTRHQTGEFGLLYHWELLSVLAGVFAIFSYKKASELKLLGWIAISALPASLTTVTPHTLRFHSASPAFAILSAIGIVFLLAGVQKFLPRILYFGAFVGVIIGITLEFFVYYHFLIIHYPGIVARDFQYGYKDMVQYVFEHKGSGPAVITREQGRPSVYYFVFNAIDPVEVQKNDTIALKDQQEVLTFQDVFFRDPKGDDRTALIASSKDKVPANAIIEHEVWLPSGEPIWIIWRYQQ
ncbi:MAG: hypothetical protein UX04_C0001G0058 [Microgenomates group bacterium GW2011_GWF2_45_18]|nr:MAG: hypothetical protein UW18_C0003G0173 [Microgenomates group bacterium GW2011_GWF1_44_10]KKU02287.1 MAG: hypothetical protein UX04_C0001G0058 [Microgenomates group bacterium GW2011_GWF2_45_18]OGJ41407.1 MAG: hypothetical protein A2378_00775 [Candidatus Pacebacteria bacterium RIFOXYB1_FULL_44_10]HAU99247.1 hypothetical protein [Candidatus Paceibacterota bacterium]HAX01778.1 hypothetical protein [Candidatus Paceibacterota bacterium]